MVMIRNFISVPLNKVNIIRKEKKLIIQLLALNAYINKKEPMQFDLNAKAICGEDWILIENNNEIKEIILNQEDIIAKQEMENAKEILKENDKHL